MSEWKMTYSLDEPYDGETILIRETYINPIHNERVENFRVITYLKRYGFSMETKMHSEYKDYRITHWMRIPRTY